jgi:opacity protein-like surface antigen
MKRTASFFIAALAVIASPAIAADIVIDFERKPDGSAYAQFEHVQAGYAAQGIA